MVRTTPDAERTPRGQSAQKPAKASGSPEPNSLESRLAPASEPRSTLVGDLPPEIARRYLSEDGNGERRYFESPSDRQPQFRDKGHRLSTGRETRSVIHDLVSIAGHRGWTRIEVKGSETFRREAWRAASLRGLEVQGYRASALEQLDLERRRAAAGADFRSFRRGGSDGRHPVDEHRARVDFREGVEGRIIASGRAAFHPQARQQTPFVDLALVGGGHARAWGLDIPDALARSGQRVGDIVRLTQVAAEAARVETPGHATRTTRRARWQIETLGASRFKQPHPSIETGGRGLEQDIRQPLEPQQAKDRRNIIPDVEEPGRDGARPAAAGGGNPGVEPSEDDVRHARRQLAERFRYTNSAEAARFPELQTAQSVFVAGKALIRAYLPDNTEAAHLAVGMLRKHIAAQIEAGQPIDPVSVQLQPDGVIRLIASDRSLHPVTARDDPKPRSVRKEPHRGRSR